MALKLPPPTGSATIRKIIILEASNRSSQSENNIILEASNRSSQSEENSLKITGTRQFDKLLSLEQMDQRKFMCHQSKIINATT